MCAERAVATHYTQPGKLDQDAYISRFNRSYRSEMLTAHLFESIAELRATTAAGSGSIAVSGVTTAACECRRGVLKNRTGRWSRGMTRSRLRVAGGFNDNIVQSEHLAWRRKALGHETVALW